MNIPQQLIEAYGELAPFLEEVERRLTEALRPFAQQRLLPLVVRVKKIESVAEKIETGRYKNFADLDDLVACTLVIPTLAHEAEAIDHCRRVFQISDVKRRAAARKPPESFRFDSTRLYGFLSRPEGGSVLGTASIFDVKFEIQLRTAFEHAWTVATHPLTYKSGSVDWKRFRLAAQIKAITEHLDASIVQFEQFAASLEEAPWPDLERRRDVAAMIGTLMQDGIVPSEASPKDMTRFADNLVTLLRASRKRPRTDEALQILDEGLRSFSADTFPKSASLLQVCIGVLCQKNVLTGPLQEYACHITEQLVQLFPETGVLTPVFEYQKKVDEVRVVS